MWYIHIMEDFLAIKMNEVVIYDIKWMSLENIMLNEKNQSLVIPFT